MPINRGEEKNQGAEEEPEKHGCSDSPSSFSTRGVQWEDPGVAHEKQLWILHSKGTGSPKKFGGWRSTECCELHLLPTGWKHAYLVPMHPQPQMSGT
ncbi:Dynein Heavy Chain 11, Axonemal [Manis pentadactyla]|nr:Dynein Heavy Chain 11, Axonemal [Manis pentadactyla]